MTQLCLRYYLRLNDHTSNLLLIIVITLHLLKVIKYYWKPRDQQFSVSNNCHYFMIDR